AAELVAARAADLAPKPRSLDHVHAAAVPLAGLTVWQALFDHAGVAAGDRGLIHGAAGGVGTFAIQFAHTRGAHVIGTASKRNVAFLEELGADEVMDYSSARFEDRLRRVDAVIDTVGGDTLDRSWGVLRPGGVLVTIAGDAPEAIAAKYGVRGVSPIASRSTGIMVSLGYPDGEVIERKEFVSATQRIARALSVPLSADIVSGFGATPREVVTMVKSVLQAGAVGINIEDLDHSAGALAPLKEQLEKLKALRALRDSQSVPFVINARTDALRHAKGDDQA